MIIINAIKTTGLWISIVGLLTFSAGCSSTPEERMDIPSNGRLPNIRPDYSGIIIPPNIAPLNFTVKDSGQNYVVHIHSKEGETDGGVEAYACGESRPAIDRRRLC
jgi:hypothetical protein